MAPSYQGLNTHCTVYYIGTISNLRSSDITKSTDIESIIRENSDKRHELENLLFKDFLCVPIYIDKKLEEDYYYGYCKKCLYPILHNILTVYDTVAIDKNHANDFHETESIYLNIFFYRKYTTILGSI